MPRSLGGYVVDNDFPDDENGAALLAQLAQVVTRRLTTPEQARRI